MTGPPPICAHKRARVMVDDPSASHPEYGRRSNGPLLYSNACKIH
jgi:hypothetical protein